MLDSGMDPVALDIPLGSSLTSSLHATKYSTSHRGQDSQPDSNTIDSIMNGVIKQKLKIIPKNFTSVACAHLHLASQSVSCQYCDAAIPNVYRWGQQSDSVYHALVNDFMKPRIDEVI
jgi:serine carboxypeptidase 1